MLDRVVETNQSWQFASGNIRSLSLHSIPTYPVTIILQLSCNYCKMTIELLDSIKKINQIQGHNLRKGQAMVFQHPKNFNILYFYVTIFNNVETSFHIHNFIFQLVYLYLNFKKHWLVLSGLLSNMFFSLFITIISYLYALWNYI